MSDTTMRFIPKSYPVLLSAGDRARAAYILGEWLEQPDRRLAVHMKVKPFTVGHFRALTDLLDVNITGASLVLDSERSGVSRRMLGASLPDDAPIATWGKKLVRLGLFCGYYTLRPNSRTAGMARDQYMALRNSPDLVWCFRSSAQMAFYGSVSMAVAREEALRQLDSLWAPPAFMPDVAETEGNTLYGNITEPLSDQLSGRYPVASRFDGRLTASALIQGLGAVCIADKNFDRFLRDADGWMQVSGDNTGITFVGCHMSKIQFDGVLNGAKFVNCTFDDVVFSCDMKDSVIAGCTGSVTFTLNKPDSMHRMQFLGSRLEVRDAYYTLTNARLVHSTLSSLDFSLGAKHPLPGNTAPFGVAAPTHFCHMCQKTEEQRRELFRGMELVNSFIDLPFAFFGDALRDAMTPEDFEAWEADAQPYLGENAYKPGEYGDVKAFGLMGDALAPLYFPELLQG